MKKQLLFTAMAVLCLSVSGFAQTNGTSAVSFGANVTTNKNSYNNTNQNDQKNSSFTLGYGYFIKDNSKIELDLSYGINNNTYSNQPEQHYKVYGGSISYQKYFPLFKSLYAYAGGNVGYNYGSQKNDPSQNVTGYESKSNYYAIGAYGGITWFLSKRFALETTLLSANASYSESKVLSTTDNNIFQENKQTSFNLNSKGFINDLGFKIYILF